MVLNNHNEPVSGLVSRFLRRKLLEFENRSGGTGGGKNHQVQQVVEWLPKVWHHVNRIIEVYNSAEVTLGLQNIAPLLYIFSIKRKKYTNSHMYLNRL